MFLSLRNIFQVSLFLAISEVSYYIYKKVYGIDKKQKPHNKTLTKVLIENFKSDVSKSCGFHRVLFFPDPGITCPRKQMGRICRDEKCQAIHGNTSLGDLIKIIGFAKESIDVCVYLITSNILGDTLVDCHNKGTIVRIITDDRNSGECGEVNAAQVGKFRAAGISVRCYAASFWMHHKFILLDNEILITGSLNWTNQAALGNAENLIVTSEPELVSPFIGEFENLFKKLGSEIH